jgi:hypothetical protein
MKAAKPAARRLTQPPGLLSCPADQDALGSEDAIRR